MHGAPDLVWDDELAELGRQKACAWTGNHDLTAGVGENLHGGTGTYTGEDVVVAWYNEIKATNGGLQASFTMETGHYTQLVWKGTCKVGCGSCQQGEWHYTMCTYKEQGNVQGTFAENVLGVSKTEAQCASGSGDASCGTSDTAMAPATTPVSSIAAGAATTMAPAVAAVSTIAPGLATTPMSTIAPVAIVAPVNGAPVIGAPVITAPVIAPAGSMPANLQAANVVGAALLTNYSQMQVVHPGWIVGAMGAVGVAVALFVVKSRSSAPVYESDGLTTAE